MGNELTPDGEDIRSADVEEIFLINDRIRQTLVEIKRLEQKREEALDDQSKLEDIDKRLRDFNKDLHRFKGARTDILGYWD